MKMVPSEVGKLDFLDRHSIEIYFSKYLEKIQPKKS